MEIEGRQFSNNRLTLHRKLCGLKQETVKRKLGLSSRSILSDWENGKSSPSLDQLRDLAKLYNCRPVDLYPFLEEMPGDTITSDEEKEEDETTKEEKCEPSNDDND